MTDLTTPIDQIIPMVPTTESPAWAQDTNFGLDEENRNHAIAQSLLSGPHNVLDVIEGKQIIESGSTIAMIVPINTKPTIIFYVKLAGLSVASIRVTQVTVWRSGSGLTPRGLAKKIFFDLLKRKPVIMSDSMQTQHGAQFWKDRMQEAVSHNLKVGLVDLGDQKVIDWFDPNIKLFDHWLKERECAWGHEDAHKDFRFLISQ